MHVSLMNTETSNKDGKTEIFNIFLDPDDGFEGGFHPKRWLIHYLEPNVVTFKFESSDRFLNVKEKSGHTVHLWDNEKSGDSHWILIPID